MKDHIVLILGEKEIFFNYKCTEGLLGDLKSGDGDHLTVSDGNYPLASLLESTMAQRCMCTHRRP